VVRDGTQRDYRAVAAIQTECAEAAQWPIGDYAPFRLLVAEIGGQIAGFCWWRQSSADEAELLNLCTASPSRRKGVASALLEKLRFDASGDIFLEVAENNDAAIALYTRLGWVPIGRRAAYYPSGADAVVMKNRSW
jgi:ribosomal-protein-alanine N-acetyltransferase